MSMVPASSQPMTPDSVLTDPEQYKTAQEILRYFEYTDKEPTGSMDEGWNAALRRYKIESNLPGDSVLDVKTFVSLSKAYVFRKMRNYTIGAAVVGALGVGGYFAYQHFKKSRSFGEIDDIPLPPY